METFVEFVARETERLSRERDQLMLQRSEIDTKIEAIDRERYAIHQYEAAKAGKSSSPAKAGTRTRSTRKGSKREDIIAAIKGSDGLTRGELLEKLGLKGSKQGEMSCSNALTGLTKAGTVIRDGGKYKVAA